MDQPGRYVSTGYSFLEAIARTFLPSTNWITKLKCYTSLFLIDVEVNIDEWAIERS